MRYKQNKNINLKQEARLITLINISVIIQLSAIRPIIKMPQNLQFPDGTNVIDIIGYLDDKYQKLIENDNKSHAMDFLEKKVRSILHLLWNPKTEQFYEDVGLEARLPSQNGETVPIEKNWRVEIPDQTWLVLTPDAGC